MKDLYQPNYHTIYELIIKEIIFEKEPECTGVSIFGFRKNMDNSKFIETHYFCEFDILTNLLIAAEAEGDFAITAIKNKLLDEAEEVPVVLNMETIIG